jgi:putative DNA primase/helicase
MVNNNLRENLKKDSHLILDALNGVKQVNEEQFQALCPAHNDSNPSLSIKIVEGESIKMHCHAGCDIEKILDSIGLEKSDLYKQKNIQKKQKRTEVATYSYEDEEGKLLFQVIRTDPKGFFQRHLGDNGWVNNIQGVSIVPYNLPKIIQAVKNNKSIYIVEGEKDCQSITCRGAVATTSPMGAKKWRADFNKYFKDASVIIIPDNDNIGREHALNIARNLNGIAKSIKIIELDGLPEKGDVSDWFEKHYKIEHLYQVVNSTPEWVPKPIEEDPIVNEETISKAYTLTDLGNAKRFVKLFGENVRFCYQNKKWLYWNEIRWVWDDNGEVIRMAKKVIQSIYIEAGKESTSARRTEIAEWAKYSEAGARIREMIKLAESENNMPIQFTQLDNNLLLLNCRNGIIDLKTGKLLPHKKEFFLTKLAPIDYIKDAKSEDFEKFLKTILPSDELRNFVNRAAGYSITGSTAEEKLFFAYGPPATGKSTFLNTISNVLGDYAATTDFDTFIAKPNGNSGASSSIARLAGKRFVMGSEVDNGKKLAESLIKQITGNDTITARFLYQEFFEFKPTFKLFLAANFRPRVDADDAAMWRRILQIPFIVQIPENQRDPKLKHVLSDLNVSGPAILNWLIEGCLQWQIKGLVVPEEVKSATEDYRNEMDPLKNFFEDSVLINHLAQVDNSDLWNEYLEWCKENGERFPLGRRSFKDKLESRGFIQSRTSKGRFWKGLKLKNEFINNESKYNDGNYSKNRHLSLEDSLF